jgi:hypothetical protein
MKVQRYQGMLTFPQRASVVPFVVESTGRLGPAARQFLAHGDSAKWDKAVKRLTLKIDILCARGNAQMITKSRNNLFLPNSQPANLTF